uniref:legumain-like n=1 Tax=Erigeron canadensis TaxID=72917 RepID=UPI001CB8B1F2|nr:legumain-like [Erigeron canadensis]
MRLFLVAVMILLVYGFYIEFAYLKLPERSSVDEDEDEASGDGITWALLVAGTTGWGNYRFQADVCHAYQLLKAGGIKDKHIVVFMYDDIAYDRENMEPGKIFNSFYGHQDVYAGVPKDYTGANVTTKNVLGALVGDKKSITGGSGKVIKSRSTDRIFIYISTHGNREYLNLPNGQTITRQELLDALEQKHARNSYKSMVIYLDACHGASMFANVLTPSLNIYAVTAADEDEIAHAEYCLRVNGMFKVKKRVSKNGTYIGGSHVMEYGDKHIKSEQLYMYHRFNQKPVNHTRTVSFSNNLLENIVSPKHIQWTRCLFFEDPITQRSEHQVWVQVYNHAESKLKCWQCYGR